MEIRYLILALTSRCNLQCRYCYMAGQQPHGEMSHDIIKKAMALIKENSAPCHIQLTGGEPTLVPELIAKVARLSREITAKTTLGIQTNATQLTPKIGNLIKLYKIQVGVSIDGAPAIQNELRGKASATLKGLKLLEEMDIPFNVTCVVNSTNVLLLDQVALLLAGFSNSRGIGLDLVVDKGRSFNRMQPSNNHLKQGIRQLIKTLMALNLHRHIPLKLRELERVRSNDQQPFCRAATGQSLAVRWDGKLFPCGQTMGDSRFSLGSISRPAWRKPTPLTTSALKSTNCSTCQLRQNCPGDCPSRNHYNKDQTPLACTMYEAMLPFL